MKHLRIVGFRLWAAALLITLSVHTHGFGINLMKVPTEDKMQTACTVGLLRKYFNSDKVISGAVLSVSVTTNVPYVQQQLLRAINAHEDSPWSILVTTLHGKQASESELIMQEKPQCYFLVIESLEDVDLDDIVENWKAKINWNPLAQFVVYLASVEETDEEMTDLMVELLLTFMNKKIFNVNVIGQSEENTGYYGKTAFPYHPDNNCGNRVIAVDLLDVCEYQNYEDQAHQGNSDESDVSDVDEEDTEAEVKSTNSGHSDELSDPVGNGIHFDEIDTEKVANNLSESAELGDSKTMEADDEGEFEDGDGNEANGGDNADQSKEFRNKNGPDMTANESGEIEDESNFTETYVRERSTNAIENSRLRKRSAEMGSSLNSSQPKPKIEEHRRAKFTDKFPKDLSGCPLVAAYRPWEPYIFSTSEESDEATDYYYEVDSNDRDESKNSSDGTEKDWDYSEADTYGDGGFTAINTVDGDHMMGVGNKPQLGGIEYEIVQTIAEQLHVNIDIQIENSNLYHLFQQLIDGEIDMIVGGIDEDPSISQFVSSTIPYHQDDLTWCVARAKRQHSFFNFLASFKADSWLLLLLFLVATSSAVFVAQRVSGFRLRKLHNFFSICIRILAVLLNQSMPVYGLPLVLRILFGVSFFMAFFFSNTYQSFLISTLTTPRSSYQISHLAEIYSNRMTILGSVENVRHLNKGGEIFRYIREKFQMCYNIVECLNNAAEDETIAVAVSRHHSFYNPRIERTRLYCFDRNENLYMYLVTMLLPKKFHLLHQINPIIRHIIESGHVQKWARDLDMIRIIHDEIGRVREDPFQALTLAQFHGAFTFAIALLLLASCIFLLECLVHWCVIRRRTRFTLLRRLHRLLRTC
ncbi:uncharacterized protein LOC115620458 [Scaptodrosophila lebanonensis]|uniref:Uncharacterized protein LOC115620458 n=1 Tax=Drosophila lebanonensis TaxID=7225 RepID=A0A6J2T0L2_DROLE|nr:uncharacterized protein LOC115620458 [Scaptodrosophila lebanonensis]